VYYTLLDAGDDDARRRAADFFTANADRLRRRLAANLQMRRTPRLIFVLDENAENAEAMARFLDSIPPDDAPPTAAT
jgi:ribosome-binding factor A